MFLRGDIGDIWWGLGFVGFVRGLAKGVRMVLHNGVLKQTFKDFQEDSFERNLDQVL